MRNLRKFYSLILPFALCLFAFSGCATVSQKEALPAYNINGTAYYPLIALCNLRDINWEYDAFAKTVALNKDSHKLNFMLGDNLILVNGQVQYISNPIDIYEGAIVVPRKFKEQIIDLLFKEAAPSGKPALPILKIRKVVIDAGHGGHDPGAVGRSGLREKDVNLDIARRLSKLLSAEGIEVVMTRSTDRFIPLARRAEIANNSKADLFIAIHSNANRVRSLNGFEVYYVSSAANDSKRAYSAARNARLDLKDACFSGSSLDLKAILWDMIYTANRAESIELSRSLCHAVNDNLGVKILGIKSARFQVLRETRSPAVLIEVGFLSNHNEEQKLKNSYYRQELAKGILEGIRGYAKDVSFLEVASR